MASRIAVISTHPIQYHGPWFRAMVCCPILDLEVLFCHDASAREQADAGFGLEFAWDVPLLDGYPYRFLKNVAKLPGVASFTGLDTPELGPLIRARKYDAVLVNGWNYKSAWQAIFACWRSKVPVLVRSDSHLHTRRNALKRAAKEVVYRSFIPRFDACLAVGRWSADYFLYYGARPERIFAVPHTIDERFSAQAAALEPRRDDLRARWGLPRDVVVCAFAGKFIPKKRPLDFVHAVARASTTGAKVAGLMVGDGPLRAECEQAAAETGALVRFAGFLNQSQIAQAYAVSDALVVPSDGRETWGLVVNEAMTCGRPAIVSDQVGCGPDLIVPGETGIVFRVGDVGALAGVMTRCAASPAELARMGTNARQHVARYSVSAAVEGVVQALAAVVK